VILKLFSIYDSKSCTYSVPHARKEEGEAIRDFKLLANDQTCHVGKFPEDYTLFCIGTFNLRDATFCIFESKNALGTASEYVVE
jgi:hypothetical protein